MLFAQACALLPWIICFFDQWSIPLRDRSIIRTYTYNTPLYPTALTLSVTIISTSSNRRVIARGNRLCLSMWTILQVHAWRGEKKKRSTFDWLSNVATIIFVLCLLLGSIRTKSCRQHEFTVPVRRVDSWFLVSRMLVWYSFHYSFSILQLTFVFFSLFPLREYSRTN